MRSDLSPEQVMSASSEELVLMLFEGAVKFAREARDAMRRGDDAEATQRLGRVTAIVRELEASLDPSAGLVGQHLAAIYEYVLRRLAEPDLEPATVDEIIDDLTALTEAWTGTVASRTAPASLS
jgi:flagellar protein FliS